MAGSLLPSPLFRLQHFCFPDQFLSLNMRFSSCPGLCSPTPVITRSTVFLLEDLSPGLCTDSHTAHSCFRGKRKFGDNLVVKNPHSRLTFFQIWQNRDNYSFTGHHLYARDGNAMTPLGKVMTVVGVYYRQQLFIFFFF